MGRYDVVRFRDDSLLVEQGKPGLELTRRLAGRLRQRFPDLAVGLRGNDSAGYRLVVNATPLGMSVGDSLDSLPFNLMRLEREAIVGDVVLTAELTRLLKAAARAAAVT